MAQKGKLISCMCEWMCVCVHVGRSAERGEAGSFSCSLSPSRYCTLANDPMELMASAIGHLCAINTALIPRVEARLERFYPKITTRRFDGRERERERVRRGLERCGNGGGYATGCSHKLNQLHTMLNAS